MKQRFWKKKRLLILAYDQGLEHGPTDFNAKNVNPQFILDIALKGGFDAVAFQKGIAEKYYAGKYRKVPLILKLNGKTQLLKGEPLAPQNCSVKQAIRLGASAVGYTLYLGSEHEPQMFEEFGRIEQEAHQAKLGVVLWMYPRGKAIKNEFDGSILAYAARVGLEFGADIIKLKYNGKPKDLHWIVQCAGKAKVVIAGGTKTEEKKFLVQAKEVIKAGASGLAVGRNVWQHFKPLEISKKLKKIVKEN